MQFEFLNFLNETDQGNQGFTGNALITKKNNEKIKVMFKLSKYLNFNINHEYLVLDSLKTLNAIDFPHFYKAYAMLKYNVNSKIFQEKIKSRHNPFNNGKKQYNVEILFIEYIPNIGSCFDLIKEKHFSEQQYISVIKQVLMAMICAQKVNNVVHYDLHTSNVLIFDDNDSYDIVHVYILNEKNVFFVPTLANTPVIIDFGFGSSKELYNKRSYFSLCFDDSGLISPAFDALVDAKTFLITSISDIEKSYDENDFEQLKNFIYDIFNNYPLNYDTGWDETLHSSILKELSLYLFDKNKQDTFFYNNSIFCLDLLQSLIILVPPQTLNKSPFNCKVKSNLRQFEQIYAKLSEEFYKLEQTVMSTNDLM